jgi:hypothetical protein
MDAFFVALYIPAFCKDGIKLRFAFFVFLHRKIPKEPILAKASNNRHYFWIGRVITACIQSIL